MAALEDMQRRLEADRAAVDLQMQRMHLREVNAHDARSRHEPLHGVMLHRIPVLKLISYRNGGCEGAELRPHGAAVTVRFGVEEDDRRERGGGGGSGGV